MKVFISYASEQRDLAARLALALRNGGMETFFDRDNLPPGESFDDRIGQAIGRSHLFIFLITRDSLRKGSYTLTELEVAQKRWPNPAGNVLPVFIDRVTIEELPPYLRAVTILDPQGEAVADTLNAVVQLARARRGAMMKRATGLTAAVLLAGGGAYTLYVTRPGVLGEKIRRVVNPPVVENVRPGVNQAGGKATPFRFDLTLYNPSPDTITTVSVAPVSDNPDVAFGSSSETFFTLNPGERRELAVTTGLDSKSHVSSFKWRVCWNYVKTEDWYAEDMDNKSATSLEIFIDRHKAEVCNQWQPWQLGS